MKPLLLTIIALLSLFSSAANGDQQKFNVTADLKALTDQIEGFEKMSPAAVNAILDQVRLTCRTNRTIDEQEISSSMRTCMEWVFNDMSIVDEMQQAIPKGNLDDVFKKMCKKWPSVQGCLQPGLGVVEDCWENGTQVSGALETMVKFFCGKENNGAYIALFFADGGLSCLQKHGNAVRECVNDLNTDDHQEDLCVSTHQILYCAGPLRLCDDVTPHNLITSMIQEVGNVMKCPPPPVIQYQRDAGSASYLVYDTVVAMFLVTIAFLA